MKLSRKKFNIQFDVNGYFVWEIFHVLGVRSITFYGAEGNCSEIPFETLETAEEKVKELEQLEEVEGPFREGSIGLFLIVSIVICFLIYKTI